MPSILLTMVDLSSRDPGTNSREKPASRAYLMTGQKMLTAAHQLVVRYVYIYKHIWNGDEIMVIVA